jgi:hypothetical protein
MPDIQHSITINAPLETVWQSWDRFGRIADFNKGLRASYLLDGSPETGKGARRQCDLKDGKRYLREELVEYVPMKKMIIRVFDSNLPVRDVRLALTFASSGATGTRIDAAMDYTMKYGLVGRVMKIAARKSFVGDITRLLQANKTYVEVA